MINNHHQDEIDHQQQQQQQQQRRKPTSNKNKNKVPDHREEEQGEEEEELFDDSLIDLLFSLPPQLINLLVIASKPIDRLAQLSLILRWSHPSGPWPSWILLLTWLMTSICLSNWWMTILSYGIPNLICLSILSITLILKRPSSTASSSTNSDPVPIKNTNENGNCCHHPISLLNSLQSFQIIVDHYSIISSNFFNPIYQIFSCSDYQRSTRAIKTCLTSIPFSLLLINYFLSIQSILIIGGSILIVWCSNWFQLILKLLWRSLVIRTITLLIVDVCIHLRFQPITRFKQVKLTHPSSSIISWIRSRFGGRHQDDRAQSTIIKNGYDEKVLEIEFCLNIFENQRWWMGLDWTPNLLPHERPNWSDSRNYPVPSPTNLKLPNPINLPGPAENLRRKVEWKWVDADWKIVEAHFPGSSTNQDSPTPFEYSKIYPGPNDALLGSPDLSHTKRTHNRSVSSIESNPMDSDIIDESLRSSGLSASVIGAHDPALAWDVDANGWQYGDNHWEKMSKKSGIGKYTRRRAWTRKARLVTTITPIETASSPTASVKFFEDSDQDHGSMGSDHDLKPLSSSSSAFEHSGSTAIKPKSFSGLLRRKP